MSKSKSIYFFIILSFCISKTVLSQSKLKVEETVKLITSLMQDCVNQNWMLYDVLFDGKPFMENNVLINENSNNKIDPSIFSKRDQYFKGEFGLDPRSDLSKKLIDPLDKEFIRMSAENPEPRDSMNAISEKQREIGVIYVYIYFNKNKIEGKKYTVEKISGAALVTKINSAYRDSCNWNSYFLGFGNWKDLKTNNGGGYSYKFRDRENSPQIENFVVVITGVESRVKELLKNVEWEKLNQLLNN